MKKNNFYCGNCIDLIKRLDTESIDLIVTDPPYNASNKGINLLNNKTGGAFYKVNEEWDKFENYSSYLKFTRNWMKEADKVLKNTGSVMICGTIHNIGEVLIILKELNYIPLNIITWKKTNPMPNITKRMLTHSTEFIDWFAKSKNWTFNYEDMKKYNNGKQLRDVWEFALCQGKERLKGKNGKAAHLTQKPELLFERLIKMASNKNDLILDPFMGIGTTAVVSEKLNRNWIGFDSDETYVKLSKKRLVENKNLFSFS